MSSSIFTKIKTLAKILPILVGVFWFLPTFAFSGQAFNVNLATNKWTDSSHYTPQQISFPTAGYLDSITILVAATQNMTSICIPTSTVNNCDGQNRYRGVVTSTGPVVGGTPTKYMTFFPSSTLGETARYFPANSTNKMFTPPNINYYYATPSNTYQNVVNWDRMGYSLTYYTLGTETAGDIWFAYNQFSTSTGEAPSSISFVATPTTTCQFQNWAVDPYMNSATMAACEASNQCSYGVAWNNDGSDLYVYVTNAGGKLTPDNALPAFWNDIYYIFNDQTFTSGTAHSARAFICDSTDTNECWADLVSGNLIAVSDQWQFLANDFNTCTTTYFDQTMAPYPTTTQQQELSALFSLANDQCNAYRDTGFWGTTIYGLCSVMVKLFIPSQNILENFSNLKNEIQSKPPFGYVSVYGNSLLTLQNVTSTTSTFSGLTSDLHLSEIKDIGIIATIKTAFGWFLWLIFGFWVFNRLRKLSLHG